LTNKITTVVEVIIATVMANDGYLIKPIIVN